MKNVKWVSLLIFSSIIITLPLITATYSSSAIRLPEGKTFVIAFDMAHDPLIKLESFNTAIKNINSTLPIRIGVINTSIDDKVLSGVDLLVILPKSKGPGYKDSEVKAISRYLEMGGSLLILGSFNSKFDLGDINDLLRSVEISDKVLFDLFSFDTSEVDGVEGGVYLYDDFSPYLNKSIIEVQVNKMFFETNASTLTIQSIAIKSSSREVKKLYATKTTYGRNSRGDPCCYLNDTPVIASFWERNKTRIAITGFAEPFTDQISPLGRPWIEVSDNLVFFKSLIFWLLKPEVFQPKQLVRPSYVYTYIASFSVVMLPMALFMRKFERKREEKREKPRKLSELLKKAKEE